MPIGFSEFKSPGGKLVKAEATCTKDACKVKITGDFFLYPEETIHALENSASGPLPKNVDAVQKQLEITLGLYQAQLYGIAPKEIAQTIWEAVQRAK